MSRDPDVVILGAGFGGSLTALLAERIGMRPLLVERGRHPRFAIGESSTPQGDLILRSLARRYALPQLETLCQYGTWKRSHPELVCGPKRGFSYFHHTAGLPFDPRPDRANELLVAASPDLERSDTHWLRADFDAFLVEEVARAGIGYLDETELLGLEGPPPWRLSLARRGRTQAIRTPFVVDAGGAAGILARALGLPDRTADLATRSSSIFAHWRGVASWGDVYRQRGGDDRQHPYPCEQAALHHVFDGGWMYVLHFDDGVTSAGLVLDESRRGERGCDSPEATWSSVLERFPSLAVQFAQARAITPLFRTGPMQRLVGHTAGPGYALLPAAACFLDPLHSSGNALNLAGVERLIDLLQKTGGDREEALAAYDRALARDVALLDRLIHGCYAGFRDFPLMVAFSMLYFAGAHFSETLRRKGASPTQLGFLNSQDPVWREIVEREYTRMLTLCADGSGDAAELTAEIASAIAPYNQAGLCDPRRRNAYPCPEPVGEAEGIATS